MGARERFVDRYIAAAAALGHWLHQSDRGRVVGRSQEAQDQIVRQRCIEKTSSYIPPLRDDSIDHIALGLVEDSILFHLVYKGPQKLTTGVTFMAPPAGPHACR